MSHYGQYSCPNSRGLSDHETADLWRAAEARRQDARFRGAMLDALERGRERLPICKNHVARKPPQRG
jgi:hypothetical protein